tara:strand:- start:1127 stop:1642 length:516 start_codon:yes stop_codon:yes gene_type:complete
MSDDKELKSFQEKIKEMVDLSEQLPQDVFAAVPDEDTVDIKISGAFSRAIGKSLEYILESIDPLEATRALEFIKADYKDVDTSLVKDYDVVIWVLLNLQNEFNAQAGLQKKTRVYDRQAFMGALMSKNPDMINPLTDDEIAERVIANQKEINAKLKADKKKKKTTKKKKKD